MTRSAAVVGAGIAGLAAAAGLEQRGWKVTVLERRTDLATAGTGFAIWPRALAALERLGLASDLKAGSRAQSDGVLRKPDGTRFAAISMERVVRRSGRAVELVARRHLLEVLARSLSRTDIRFAVAVLDPRTLAQDHDVVVVADGINSDCRTSLFGSRHAPRHAGARVWRGLAPMRTTEASETWGRGCKFGITPLGPAETNWYAVIAADEGWQPPRARDALLERFGTWHSPIPEILEQFDRSEVLTHDLHYLAPPLPTYVRDNVAVVGDAAHAMTPDLGQGACQALIDGLTLAECLTGDLQQGLREFDRRRRPPTQRLARVALLANRLSRVSRFPSARDLALRLALLPGPPM